MDVVSFGIIVMELITKRSPTGLTEEERSSITLPQLVQKALKSGTKRLLQVVDPHLVPYVSKKQEATEGLLNLALSCTSPDPEDRPDMEEVLSCLSKLRQLS